MEGRKLGSSGNILAQAYIENSLKLMEVEPFKGKYLHPFNKSLKKGNNITGFVKGSEFPNRVIVISAHFDHIGTRGSAVFNGADDNASGVSALLGIARELSSSPLRNSVLFLFADGEEYDLSGTKAFVEQQPQLLENIVLNLNIDMISGTKNTTTLHFISEGLNRILTRSTQGVSLISVKEANIKIKKGFRGKDFHSGSLSRRNNWKMASDHGVFHRKNIPFIYFGVGTHKNYHTSNDTFENANLEFYHKAVNFIYMQLKNIDEQTL